VYVFLDFRVVIIKKGEIVEASFMMMNQVDSSSFDDNKDDDKKPKRMISRTRFKNQEKFDFKIQEKDEFEIQEKKSRRLHKGSIEKIFQKTNIAWFCFSKDFFSKFSKLPEFLLSGNQLPITCKRLPVAKFDFKKLSIEFATFQLISKWCNRLQDISN